jgi:hypothetical protein|tara:strand:- start:838 stop:1098 length:261 start_codon:yes stop_codon:yes gene_type:complete
MIKALLIVSALGGGAEYTTEMPSMESCLNARTQIMEQDNSIKTLCVPSEDEREKLEEFLLILLNMVDMMKERENDRFGSRTDQPAN